ALFQHRHHLAHVLDRAGAHFGDSLLHSSLHRRLVHLGGHEGADNDDFGFLILGQLGAAALAIDGGGFLALLDHLGQQGEDFVVAQKFAAGLAARGDVTVLQRRQHQAHRGQALGVLGLHRLFHGVIELGAQGHGQTPNSGGGSYNHLIPEASLPVRGGANGGGGFNVRGRNRPSSRAKVEVGGGGK